MTVKSLASGAMHVVRTGLVSVSIFQFAVGNSFAAGAPPAHAIPRQRHRHADQACDRDRRRKPQLRSRVCNLCAEERREGLESAVRRDRESRRNAGRNFSKAEQSRSDRYRRPTDTCSSAQQFLLRFVLPAPLVGGPTDSYVKNDSLTLAKQSENGLACGLLRISRHGGHGPGIEDSGHAHHGCEFLPAGRFN